MGRTLTKKKKGKNSKAFNPPRDYVNEAIKDYLERGGKITKIIEDSEDYDPFGVVREEIQPTGGFTIGY